MIYFKRIFTAIKSLSWFIGIPICALLWGLDDGQNRFFKWCGLPIK